LAARPCQAAGESGSGGPRVRMPAALLPRQSPRCRRLPRGQQAREHPMVEAAAWPSLSPGCGCSNGGDGGARSAAASPTRRRRLLPRQLRGACGGRAKQAKWGKQAGSSRRNGQLFCFSRFILPLPLLRSGRIVKGPSGALLSRIQAGKAQGRAARTDSATSRRHFWSNCYYLGDLPRGVCAWHRLSGHGTARQTHCNVDHFFYPALHAIRWLIIA
jgi:hypothetical protein